MQNNFKTDRLDLSALTLSDAGFIFELVNTPGWIRFIGDRNIKTDEDANHYTQKIIDNPDVSYFVVKLREEQVPIGIITLIKREYLEHPDIGFAFLPNYMKQGYAFEAASVVLNTMIKDPRHTQVLATTIKENTGSVRLLEKLGFFFNKDFEAENQQLRLYSASADKISIDGIIRSFYSIFTNINTQQPHWDQLFTLCLPETIIIKKEGTKEEICNLQTFIEPRKELLSNGTLREFQEYETTQETKITGNIAQRFSKYKKSGSLNGQPFKGSGSKMFQLVKTTGGWKINAVIWEDDQSGN